MKNKDFDFIKSKFDNAMPEVPYALDENIIRQKLLSENNGKRIKMPKRKNIKPLISAVACIILVAVLVIAFYPDNDKIASFKSYEEINTLISSLDNASVVKEAGSGQFYSEIEEMENGVVKPSEFVTDGEYIYYAHYDYANDTNKNKVYIYRIDNGKSEFVAVIDNIVADKIGEYDDKYYMSDIYVYNNRLAVNIEKTNPMLADENNVDLSTVITQIYDITDRAKPTLISEFEQSGDYYRNSRLVDNVLYIASDFIASADNVDYMYPKIRENENSSFIDAEKIYSFENAKTAQYVVINAIDIETAKLVQKPIAILGGSPKFYCTDDYMYISEYTSGELYGEAKLNIKNAMKLKLDNFSLLKASEEEVQKYSNRVVDLGKNDTEQSCYSSVLYPYGENYINVGNDINELSKYDITLYDSNMNELDSIVFENDILLVVSPIAMDNENGIFAVPAYFTDNNDYSGFGYVAFEIKNNKILITDKVNSGIMPDFLIGGTACLFNDGIIYSIVVDYYTPDSKRLIIYSADKTERIK